MEKLFNPEVSFLFDLFGDDIRLVGGAVRDFLLAKKPKDFDFATTLMPQDVIKILQKNQLAYKDYAISYGTVSVLLKRKAYEITTLRTDEKCTGRQAQVALGKSYRQDAFRRDFTINALYMDRRGAIFDYVGGFEDLQNKKLCFIGSAKQRIKEDYLRILRLFRFWSDLPDFSVDVEDIEACCLEKEGLKKLSDERKTTEMLKILQGAGCVHVLTMMQKMDILSLLLPKVDLKRLKNFLAEHPSADVWQKLAVLTPEIPPCFVLSKSQKNKLNLLYKERK